MVKYGCDVCHTEVPRKKSLKRVEYPDPWQDSKKRVDICSVCKKQYDIECRESAIIIWNRRFQNSYAEVQS